MKLLFCSLIYLLCLGCSTCYATHIFGGELLYQYQSGKTYKITLTLYGDCSGTYIGTLDTGAPVITIYYNGSHYYDTLVLNQEAISGYEVSPICPKELWNTTCKGGSLPGVRKFIFSNTISLPFQSGNWVFSFIGNTGKTTSAGRSNAITNIAFPVTTNSSVMCLQTMLNNVAAPNSSPQYTTIPTPFYCDNIHQQYNQGAADSDNDSLVFSLTPALENGLPITYLSPYTATKPMATSDFSFDSTSGQMNFTPNLGQDAVIVTLVQEYRNGILVGTSMREMTFIILNNCNNHPPISIIDTSSISGGVLVANNTINVCEGEPMVSFKLRTKDDDNDSITVNTANPPPAASLNVTDNNTLSPFINFNWNTISSKTGTYNFYVNLKDNGCPLSSNQTIAYTIKIIKPAEASYSVINPTRCLYDQHVRINIINGTLPRTVTLSHNNVNIKTYKDSTGIIQDLLKPGTYHLFISSPYLLCNSTYDFTVVDSGTFPYHPIFTSPHYCLHDIPYPLTASPGHYGTILWYDLGGNLLPGAPSFSTDTPRVFQWLVSELYNVCESNRDTLTVFVHPKPKAQILNEAVPICSGDVVYLKSAGGTTYTWLPEDKIFIDKDSTVSTRITEPTTYSLIAITEFNCKDTATITYSDIQPCCTFSYPSAFTPNGDHLNDGFKPILYGNPEYYHLSIYNRWGQRVFNSDNINEYWDGNFGGRTCDADTYFYFVQAKCYSGHMEEHKGEFILIR